MNKDFKHMLIDFAILTLENPEIKNKDIEDRYRRINLIKQEIVKKHGKF